MDKFYLIAISVLQLLEKERNSFKKKIEKDETKKTSKFKL